MISKHYKDAATDASPISGPAIVTDFDDTLEFTDFDGHKSHNQPLIGILKQWLASGHSVIGTTDGGIDKMRDGLQPHFTPDEMQKIHFFDKPDMRTALRQRDGDRDPVVPVMVFDNAPKITYLDQYELHAYIPLIDIVALRKPDGTQENSSYESIAQRLFKPPAALPTPSASKLAGNTL